MPSSPNYPNISAETARKIGAWVFLRASGLFMLCLATFVVGLGTYVWIYENSNSDGLPYTMLDFFFVRTDNTREFFVAVVLMAVVHLLLAGGLGNVIGAVARRRGGRVAWAGALGMAMVSVLSGTLFLACWCAFSAEVALEVGRALADERIVVYIILGIIVGMVGAVFGRMGAFLLKNGLLAVAAGAVTPSAEAQPFRGTAKAWLVAQAVVALVILILYGSSLAVFLNDYPNTALNFTPLQKAMLISVPLEIAMLLAMCFWMGRGEVRMKVPSLMTFLLLVMAPASAAGLAYITLWLRFEKAGFFLRSFDLDAMLEFMFAVVSFALPLACLQVFCMQVMRYVQEPQSSLLPARFAPGAAAEAEGVPAD